VVIDSSALIAILEGEPESRMFRDLIISDEMRLISAATMVETSIVALCRRGKAGIERLQAFIARADIHSVALQPDQVSLAIDAFRRFGKGRHKAGLNLGDCFPTLSPRPPANRCFSKAAISAGQTSDRLRRRGEERSAESLPAAIRNGLPAISRFVPLERSQS
jgi:ribonuclease VapC